MTKKSLSLDELRAVPQVEVLEELARTFPLAIGETMILSGSKVTRRGTKTLAMERVDEFVSLPAAATLLGLASAGVLRVQIERGTLHAAKVGGRWLLTRTEMERYRRDSLGKHGRKPNRADTAAAP